MAKNEGEKSTVAEREFKGDEVTVKFYCIGSDIFATQIYKKQISATNPPNPPNSTCTTSTIQKNAENKDPPTSNEVFFNFFSNFLHSKPTNMVFIIVT